jgi:multimeric flavodoxin WrbA
MAKWIEGYLARKSQEETGNEISTSIIDAAGLHIVGNLSCYASGGLNCASYEAGPYRCWAHHNSKENPEEYGGVDEMPVIYDAIESSDAVIFLTSVRWGSHSALMQKIIERMNTLENRTSVYGEPNFFAGKRCGVVVTGQHWKSQDVSSHLITVFNLMGFSTNSQSTLSWQSTYDMNKEQTGDNRPALSSDMRDERFKPLVDFIELGVLV